MARSSARRYDVTIKDLVQERPRDALILAGVTDVLDAQYEDTDLSALIAIADKVLRVRGSLGEYLAHFEFQSGADSDLVDRIFWYNAALYYRHRIPVLTVVVLLTPNANSPKLNGEFRIDVPEGNGSTTFSYKVIRLWEVPVEGILNGPIGILPFAPLCKGSDDIGSVVAKIEKRFRKELKQSDEGKYWLAVCTLMGLYYDADMVFQLLPKGKVMRESSTYQAIMDEGRQEGHQEGRQEGRFEEARRMLLRFGESLIGSPTADVRARLNAIDNVAVIESMAERVSQVADWDELLKPAAASRRKTRRKKA